MQHVPRRRSTNQKQKQPQQPEVRELVTTLQFDTSELVSEINKIIKEIKVTDDLHREVLMLRRRVEALERSLGKKVKANAPTNRLQPKNY